MRLGLFAGLCVLLASCVSAPQGVSKPEGVAFFGETDLSKVDDAVCAQENEAKEKSQAYWLCAYGWRPAKELPGGQKAVETYRLLWARAFHPRMAVRVSLYPDGSGAMWATTDIKDGSGFGVPGPHTQAITLKPGELMPLLGRLDASSFWTVDQASAQDITKGDGEICTNVARWILEGERADGHRVISVQSCGDGQWVINLATGLLRFAQSRFPGLPIDPIY